MWKYVSRRFRDTFERSANHFDKRSSAVINPSNGNLNEDKNKNLNSPCCWFVARKCGSRFRKENDTNNKKWNFEQLNRTWIGAITWSSALVFGWYTSQLIHLNFKQEKKLQCKLPHNFWFELLPFLAHNKRKNKPLNIKEKLDHLGNVPPIVHLISNDHIGDKEVPSSSSSSHSSDDDLGEVLNSIENRLGLAAIENGHQQDGLNLLRSAANRSHPPALYNLGLCYERGLGVEADEKMAMEFYKSAAALQHPGALYNLGVYYGQGRGGLPKDRVTATRLLRLAAVQGQHEAITALQALDDKPTDTWAEDLYKDAPMENPSVPMHTALFVDNVNALYTCNYKYEPVF